MAVPSRFSRRSLLFGSAATLACGRRKATRYPGYCFVANERGHSLAVVDLSTFTLRHTLRLDAAPSAVLAHPRERTVYALAGEAGVVYEIGAAPLGVTRRARAGNQAIGMRVTPDGQALWVLAREPAALVEIPLDSFRPRRTIRLPEVPGDFDIGGGRAAITAPRAGAVMMASLESASLERAVALGHAPSLVSFQQKGAQVLAGSSTDRSLTMIDSASGGLLVRLPVPIAPIHLCFTQDQGQAFVSGKGRDAVVIVYPYATEVGETILAGRAPGALAVATVGGASYLLAANPETDTVTALDIDTRKLAAVVQVGQEPCDILITPDNQYALVLNQKSGDLAVIRTASLAGRRTLYKSAPLFTLIPVGDKPVGAAVVTFA
jgi:YVTN family beta-propeller protein